MRVDVSHIKPGQPGTSLNIAAWRYQQVLAAAELPFSEQELLFCTRHLLAIRGQWVEPRHITQHLVSMASTPLAARLLPDPHSFIERLLQLGPHQVYKLLDMAERETLVST